jgi:hypothetical protein
LPLLHRGLRGEEFFQGEGRGALPDFLFCSMGRCVAEAIGIEERFFFVGMGLKWKNKKRFLAP